MQGRQPPSYIQQQPFKRANNYVNQPMTRTVIQPPVQPAPAYVPGQVAMASTYAPPPKSSYVGAYQPAPMPQHSVSPLTKSPVPAINPMMSTSPIQSYQPQPVQEMPPQEQYKPHPTPSNFTMTTQQDQPKNPNPMGITQRHNIYQDFEQPNQYGNTAQNQPQFTSPPQNQPQFTSPPQNQPQFSSPPQNQPQFAPQNQAQFAAPPQNQTQFAPQNQPQFAPAPQNQAQFSSPAQTQSQFGQQQSLNGYSQRQNQEMTPQQPYNYQQLPPQEHTPSQQQMGHMSQQAVTPTRQDPNKYSIRGEQVEKKMSINVTSRGPQEKQNNYNAYQPEQPQNYNYEQQYDHQYDQQHDLQQRQLQWQEEQRQYEENRRREQEEREREQQQQQQQQQYELQHQQMEQLRTPAQNRQWGASNSQWGTKQPTNQLALSQQPPIATGQHQLKENRSHFKEIVFRCQETNTKFEDPEFPANEISLHNNNPEFTGRWANLFWMRPEQFLHGDRIMVFKDKIEPQDILQGGLGDCYFLCTLAALAEWPDRIRKLFMCANDITWPVQEIAEVGKQAGVFFVNILVKGELTEVVVDDMFVVQPTQQGTMPAFTRSNDCELWVMILEKAWAKVHGNFGRIEAGLTTECLHDLTGAPTRDYYMGDNDEALWQAIINGERNQYVMTCGTANTQGMEVVNDFGIAGGHAYSLLAGYEVNTSQGRERLVKIRNPWGDKEWLGRFSDNSHDWQTLDHPTVQRLQAKRKPNDGTFFMPFSDFVQQFYDVQVCMVNDSFKYNFLKSSCSNKRGVMFRIDVRTAGQYYFTINQQSKRTLPRAQQDNFTYPYATIVLGKLQRDNTLTFVEDVQKAFREVWTSKGENQMLEVGTYYLFAKVGWNRSASDEFVLSSYGSDNVVITQANDFANQHFLQQVYLHHAFNVSSKVQSLAEHGQPGITYCIDRPQDAGYYYVAAQNNGSQTFNLTMTVSVKSDDVKFKKPYSGESATVTVQPGQRQIALLRIRKFNVAFSASTAWSLG